jgi:ubiquinone/menaquinone biosynthesis C-methylase UbiE
MFSDPKSNIEQFELQSGARVADLGSGSGFYALAAAVAVGDKGKVYAVDVQKDLLDKLRNEALKRGLSNIEVVWGDAERIGGAKIKDGAVDAAIVANLLFQLSDKVDFPNELRRILKPKGRVLLIDWLESFGGMGPAPSAVVTEKAARELFEKNGFIVERQIKAGAHHWGLILRKQESVGSAD